MSIYEKQAEEIYEHFYSITKNREHAKKSALFLCTNLMRFAQDRIYLSKVVLAIDKIII